MSHSSDSQMLNVLKIDEKILKDIFGLSFRDKKIEADYLNYYMKLNKMLRYFVHFCYLVNFAHKIIKGIFTHFYCIFIFQIIITILYVFVCICFYISKNSKHKKFFDISAALINYIYQVLYLICLIYFYDIMDLHFRTKALFLLTTLSIFEILFSLESGLIIPVFMLSINVLLNLLIYIQYNQLKDNIMMIFLTLFVIISSVGYKRKMDELNRISFIQQHIFKKYYLYYYDFINNINGFHFSIRSESLIKINNNLKIGLKGIEETSLDKSIKSKYNKTLSLSLEAKKKILEEENKKYKYSIKICSNLETNINNTYDELNYTNNILSNDKKDRNSSLERNDLFKIEIFNEKIHTFMKSLLIKNIADKFIKSNICNMEIFNLYDLYHFIKEKELNCQFISEHSKKQRKISDILKEFKKDSIKENEENLIIDKIIIFENDSINFNKFKLLGEFESSSDKKIYQVFFRRIKEYENIFDFSLYDITNIKEAERVKAENEIKNKFFAKVAHEFKTPINSIVGLIRNIKAKLEIFSKKFDYSNNSNNMYYIDENSSFLSELNQAESLSNYTIFLVHDIIDHSRTSQSIDYKVKLEKINVLEIVDFCKNILKSLLMTKEKDNYISIEITNDELLDENNYIIYSDTFRIKQILLNFISNSVKFTKTGFIKIKTEIKNKHIETLKKNDISERDFLTKKSINVLKISVIDSGMGLKEEEMKNIFDEKKNFPNKDYNKEGSGLGLSICKYIADILNHKIEVSSIYGIGTEFSINLDCELILIVKKFFNFYTIINSPSKPNSLNKGININKSSKINIDKKQFVSGNFKTKMKNECKIFKDISAYSNSSCETRIVQNKNINLNLKEVSSGFESEQNSDFELSLSDSSKIESGKNVKSDDNKKKSSFLYYDKKENESSYFFQYNEVMRKSFQSKNQKFLHVKSCNPDKNKTCQILFKKNDQKKTKINKLKISALHKNSIVNNLKRTKISLRNDILYNTNEDYLFKKKILIVDDHKIVRESIVFLVMKCIKNLKKENEFEIIEGKDGIDILNNLINDQYNNNLIKCVITDENMEYINGSEAIEIIRKLEKNKKIQNIFIASITAFEDELSKSKIYSSGVDKILPKPCSEKIMKDFLVENKIL